MISLVNENQKTKPMNKHNKTEIESQIQRTDRWFLDQKGLEG